MKSRLLSTAYVGVFTLGINISVYATDYTFTKIIDTNDTIPGRTDTFTRFDLPSLDGRDVAFAGDRNSDYSAVFTYIGGSFSLVADSTMPIPGGVSNFDTLEIPIIDQGSVVFVGTQNSGYEAHGIYTDLGGSLRMVADHNTPIPGGTGNFGFFDDESHDFGNGVPAFTGWDSDFRISPGTTKQGVYAEINGTLTVVADENTPHPDGGNFGAGGVAGVDGANVAFTGSNSVVQGAYLNSAGTISTIIDSNTLIPGSTDTFSFLAQVQVDVAEGTFVFVHVPDGSIGRSGIYSNVGGTLHLVGEIGDTTPDGIGSFSVFDNLAVDGDELAFNAGEDSGDGGIYRYFDGVLDEVITTDDMLDGKSLISMFITSSGLDDGAIAFRANFEDGSSGIYLAEVSNPCAGFVACFQDVPDSYWAASQIETIANLGITSGCDETHYCPTDPVNRTQMAVFVERGMRGGGYDPGPGVGNIFEDVPAGYWAGGWIELLYMDGITGGCDATHYCPSQLTTRAEMAVFLLRAKYGMDYAPPTPVGVFNDVAVTYWAAGWIEQLAAEGITSGCGGGKYCPADPVNRDQMAVFLVRTFELE